VAEDKKWMLTIGQRREASPLPFPDKNPVKEIKEGMEVIQETKRVAEEISGAGKLKEELDKTKDELEKQRQEEYRKEMAEIREMLKKAIERDDTPAIKELQVKLEEAKEQYHREQLETLRQEIIKLQESRERGADITTEIRRIKELGQELGLNTTTGTATVPADIQLQLKKMDIDLQLQLAKMNEERDRRDKEWQLALKKWEEERALREQEMRQKYEAEKDKMETLKSTFERGAKIVGRAIAEPEEEKPSLSSTYHVEAGEGEMGEFACPKCISPIAVAPDAIKAICAKCGFTATIRRVKVEPQKQAT
jgi:DNA repair exonuclease SbcCD ATPase subunit